MLGNLKPELAAQAPYWEGWEGLYTPREQRGRIVARLLGDPWTPGVDMPSSMRQGYEEQLANFFDEHPFLRNAKTAANIVFEAYLFADALVDPAHPLRGPLAAYIEGRHALPSHLLADFYFFFREAGHQPIPLTHVGILYGSVLSGETESRRVHLEVDAGDPEVGEWDEAEPTVEFEWIDPTATDPADAELDSVTAPVSVAENDRLTFRRLLKDATISVPTTVRLAAADLTEFVIGPEVQIRAKRLEIMKPETLVVKGPVLRTGGPAEAQLVVLDAIDVDVTSVRTVTSYGVLAVSWPRSLDYPWTPYSADPPPESIKKDMRLAAVYRRFRRIAMSFRSHKKGQLARLKAKIKHARMLQGEMGGKLLAKLLADKVLKEDGRLYFWNGSVADTLIGVSWQDLRRGRTPKNLVDYLMQFVNANRDMFKTE
jgi:hypothetical protein